MRRTEVDNQANSGTVSRRRGRALALFAAVGCGLILGMVMFFGVGRWLVVEDPLGKAQASAVLSEGVPAGAIRVLEPTIVNTADELNAIAAALAKEKDRTAIIVTTKAHTRRVRMLWQRLGSGRGTAIVRGAAEDSFDPRHWWRTTSDALDVVREVLGLMNAWAGLPLHPAK